MNKKYYFKGWSVMMLSLLFLVASCKTTQKTATSNQKTTTSLAAKEKALLWKITGKDIKTPSYLYGTIHMIKKDAFFLPKGTQEAFEAADKIVMEIDINEAKDPAIMGKLMGMLFMEGTTLKDLLSEDDYKKVRAKLSENPMVAMMGDMVDRIKPIILSSMITQKEMGGGSGGGLLGGGAADDNMKSYEFEFAAMAEKSKKPVSGLETIDYQMSMFDAIPLQEQADMLVKGLEADEEESKSMVEKMISLYTDQDIPGLYTFIQESSENSADFEDKLLITRNKNWIPLMAEMMAKEPHFFAVGAGHLGGEQGVIALLRKEGYSVQPVKK